MAAGRREAVSEANFVTDFTHSVAAGLTGLRYRFDRCSASPRETGQAGPDLTEWDQHSECLVPPARPSLSEGARLPPPGPFVASGRLVCRASRPTDRQPPTGAHTDPGRGPDLGRLTPSWVAGGYRRRLRTAAP